MYTDQRIDYTKYLKENNTKESNPHKLAEMKASLVEALRARGVHGKITAEYYTDGVAGVKLNDKFYGCFDTKSGKWFEGYVGG